MFAPTAEALRKLEKDLNLSPAATVKVGETLVEMQLQVWVLAAEFVEKMHNHE